MVEQVSNLFKEHEHLILGLNIFLPPEKHIHQETLLKKAPDAETHTTDEEAEANAKSNADSSAPQPPKTAFNFFENHMGPKVLRRHPNISEEEIAAEIRKMWDNMNSIRQKPYICLSVEDEARYKEEMKHYTAPK